MKFLSLVVFVMLLGCMEQSPVASSPVFVDTVYVEGGEPSEFIYLVATTPTRYYVETSDSTRNGYYVSESDLLDSNGISVKKVLARGEFTGISAYPDILTDQYDGDIIICNPSSDIGFMFDHINFTWKSVEMSDVYVAQSDSGLWFE